VCSKKRVFQDVGGLPRHQAHPTSLFGLAYVLPRLFLSVSARRSPTSNSLRSTRQSSQPLPSSLSSHPHRHRPINQPFKKRGKPTHDPKFPCVASLAGFPGVSFDSFVVPEILDPRVLVEASWSPSTVVVGAWFCCNETTRVRV
jgi:hypothetical protein